MLFQSHAGTHPWDRSLMTHIIKWDEHWWNGISGRIEWMLVLIAESPGIDTLLILNPRVTQYFSKKLLDALYSSFGKSFEYQSLVLGMIPGKV